MNIWGVSPENTNPAGGDSLHDSNKKNYKSGGRRYKTKTSLDPFLCATLEECHIRLV